MPAYGETQNPAGKERNLEYIIRPTNRGKTPLAMPIAKPKQIDNTQNQGSGK